jgi:ABC-2 type transport system ATP-binding protein
VTAVIRVTDVSKRFRINSNKSLKEHLIKRSQTREHTQEFWALRDVSFEVESGTTLGLIGHNGSGKSTLLKAIGGIIEPTTGFIERRGRLAALLELGAGFQGDLTGRENVFLNASILGLTHKQTEQYFDAIVDFSGIEQFIDTPVKFYSSGMYVRLAFSVAIHVDPEILLVDEVLAVGDEPFQIKCLEKIKSFQREGRTIVFVTHGLSLVREMCDRVILLDHGRVQMDGDPVEAVRFIRDTWQAEAITEAAAHQIPDARVGTGSMTISDVRILDRTGDTSSRFRPGDAFGVEFTVDSPRYCDDWIAGIAIENHADQLCYGVNTHLAGMVLDPIEGRRRVRMSFPRMSLAEGNYHVTVAVHGETGPEYARLNRVGNFRVYSSQLQDGPVFLEPSITVDTPGSYGLGETPAAVISEARGRA